ncbi:MAG: PIN domain-containing protein [Gemmatimonadota bacterium]
MAYLFDTDAISELFRPRPLPGYVAWLRRVSREDQFTSAVVVGELFEGAFLSGSTRHLENLERRVLPTVIVLPYDAGVARVFGRIGAVLRARNHRLADADLQIAATALHHGLELVTGNVRHFKRVPELKVGRALADARGEG